ncbi:MAG TPA: hypothetical protein VIO14_00035 [Dehalococcoidia bacterium]
MFGALICALSAAGGLALVIGVLRKSYWALAAPVTLGTLGALYVIFWIGRALLTTPTEPQAGE